MNTIMIAQSRKFALGSLNTGLGWMNAKSPDCGSRQTDARLCATTALILLMGLGIALPDAAIAGSCTIAPGALTNGDSTVCTGTFTDETYTVWILAKNVTVTNEGDWTVTGDLPTAGSTGIIGIYGISANDNTGLTIVNNGSVTWNEADKSWAPALVDRTYSVLGSHFITRTKGMTVINNGTITATAGAAELHQLTGIGAMSKSGVNTVQNTGSIIVNGEALTNALPWLSGIVSTAGDEVYLSNSGTIDVTGGDAVAEGIEFFYVDGSAGYADATIGIIDVSNSGTITVKSGAKAYGLSLFLVDDVSAPQVDQITYTNSGTMTVTSDSVADAAGIYLESNVDSVPIIVTNSGMIDSPGYAIHASDATVAPIHIENSGTLTGDVDTSSGEDIYRQTAGSLTGDLLLGIGDDQAIIEDGTVVGDAILGLGDDVFTLLGGSYTGDIFGDDVAASVDDGDDTFTWSGGTLNSGFYGGNGSDTANVSASGYDGTQVLDGGDDYGTADGWIDTLTLSGISATASGADILNWEIMTIDGGTLTISDGTLEVGAENGTGLSVTGGGTLNGGTGLALTGNLSIDSSAFFEGFGGGAGTYAISGDLINGGTITTQDGAVGDLVSVGGDYTGSGALLMDVDTASDSADMLAIEGDSSGSTAITLTNLSPDDATGNDIDLVTVAGSSAAGDFSLSGGTLSAGAFDYSLAYDPGLFYLSSAMNGTGVLYEASPYLLSTFNRLPTLEQRVGQRKWHESATREGLSPSQGAWIRGYGDRLETRTDSGTLVDTTFWALQAGYDAPALSGDYGDVVLGLNAQYGSLNGSVKSELGTGDFYADGLSVGASGTWYHDAGTYLDVQGQVNWLSADFSSSSAGKLSTDTDVTGYALSAEIGHRFGFAENWNLVPQAQLNWGWLDADAFTDNTGATVDLGDGETLIGRIGVALEYEDIDVRTGGLRKGYLIGNILRDFADTGTVRVGGAALSASTPEIWGEIGAGGSMVWDTNKTLYGEALYRTPLNDDAFDDGGIKMTAGLRFQF